MKEHISNMVVRKESFGDRIIVSDVLEIVHFLRYRSAESPLISIGDDTTTRWATVTCMLDFFTLAIADKLGKISWVILPLSIDDNVGDDHTGTKSLRDKSFLSGASQKS